jgi:hypothetical protein
MGEIECCGKGEERQRHPGIETQRETCHSSAFGLIVSHHHRQFIFAGGKDDQHLDIGIEDIEEGEIGRREDTRKHQISQH